MNTKSHFALHFGKVLLHKIEIEKDPHYNKNPHIYKGEVHYETRKDATNL